MSEKERDRDKESKGEKEGQRGKESNKVRWHESPEIPRMENRGTGQDETASLVGCTEGSCQPAYRRHVLYQTRERDFARSRTGFSEAEKGPGEGRAKAREQEENMTTVPANIGTPLTCIPEYQFFIGFQPFGQIRNTDPLHALLFANCKISSLLYNSNRNKIFSPQ